MAIIQIKRSEVTATPTSLTLGELAYSEVSDTLFIGKSGSVVAKIGGFTDVDKLAGIEALADVTDATNVAAAGAVMDGDITAPDGMMIKIGVCAYDSLKLNLVAIIDPVATDDSALGYSVGSRWINTIGNEEFVCVDNTATSAIWIAVTGGGDLNGPASATNNAIARYNGVTGKLVQDSLVTIADTTGNINTQGDMTAANFVTAGLVDGRDVATDGTV